MSWMEDIAAGTPVPKAAAEGLDEVDRSWKEEGRSLRSVLEGAPDGSAHIAHLLGISTISRRKIIKDPEALSWLLDPAVCLEGRGGGKMQLERKTLGSESAAELRRFKARELLRIAFREVAGLADIRQSGEELAALAEACVAEVWENVRAELYRRWGDPGEAPLVLGMGKLGGSELNYSSDIDLVFFYGAAGEVKPGFSRQQYFERMCERFLKEFSAPSPAGELFRVDLRLRPEGDSGAIVRSFESMENYYAGYGETWERMALGKARRICGSRELAYEFEQSLQSFIYPRTVSPDLLDEIAVIKERIERDVVGAQDLYRNVKLGRGGIREIEFVTQTLQLVHGSRNAFLQQRNTLRGLEGLAVLDLIPKRESELLRVAYIFLRKVEHRLQIVEERQTHTLPEDPAALDLIARSLGFAGTPAFLEEYAVHTGGVRRIFEGMFSDGRKASPDAGQPIFADPERAKKRLGELGAPNSDAHVSPRTRRLYRRLEPLLLSELDSTADPDATLNSFVDFVDAYGIRGLLYETLSANPRLLELFVKLFDSSHYLARIAIHRPQWIEEIARSGLLSQSWTSDQHRAALAEFEPETKPPDALRRYRQFHSLRIGLRDILGLVDDRQFFAEYSAFAEACLIHAASVSGCGPETAMIALGKFGAAELGYGADLDVVFVGTDISPVERLLNFMTARTDEGLVFPVDTRLRPEGVAGPLATSLATYEAYFASRAQLWEKQSLTKARVLCGEAKDEIDAAIDRIWRADGGRPDLFTEIRAMFARVLEHRAAGKDDFKTGAGGIMTVEFIVQSLQMRHGIREANTWMAIEKLAAAGALDREGASALSAAFSFLRKLEKILRRMDDRSVSEMPSDRGKREQLSWRLGFSSTDELDAKLAAVRGEVEALFASLPQ